MCHYFTDFILKTILMVLNVPILLFGASLMYPMLLFRTLEEADNLDMEAISIEGLAIGSLAIVGALVLVFSLNCGCFSSRFFPRFLIIVYCAIFSVKILIEIAFLVQIYMTKSSIENKLEEYLVAVMLKAGGMEELAEKNMKYKEFHKLPDVKLRNKNCSDVCRHHENVMKIIQKQSCRSTFVGSTIISLIFFMIVGKNIAVKCGYLSDRHYGVLFLCSLFIIMSDQFDCCGIKRPEDWYKVMPKLPSICCEDHECKEIIHDGCLRLVSDFIKRTETAFFYTILFAIHIQIICIGLAIFLFISLKEPT